jgi:hypothetical protein
MKKDKADGVCGICGKEVLPTNLNLFYCSEPCRIKAWNDNHPDEEEPDWDSFPHTIFYN